MPTGNKPQLSTLSIKSSQTRICCKWLLSLLICLAVISSQDVVIAQDLAHYNSDSFWKNIIVHSKEDTASAEDIIHADTIVAMVSNRIIDLTKIKFAAELSHKNGVLHYMLIYVQNSKWHLVFFPNLDELLSRLPAHKSLTVYTEGYGKVFTTGIFRALAMKAQYGENVLYLDYPSINTQKGRISNWQFVNKEAQKAGSDFLPILKNLQHFQFRNKRFISINFFYHSMGNLALQEILLRPLPKGFSDSIWVTHLIMNAPCVSASKSKKWINKIDFAQDILIHYNVNDKVLKGAHLVSFDKKLGQQIPKNITNGKIKCVNFKPVVDEQHSYFLQLPNRFILPNSITQYIQSLLQGKSIPWDESSKFKPILGSKACYEILN